MRTDYKVICFEYLRTKVLCGYVAVLSNLRKLLHRLEQCLLYEKQQTMSDEPGIHLYEYFCLVA